MKPALAGLVFMYGCAYIQRPHADAADPVTWALNNTSNDTLYVALADGETPLGASITLAEQNGTEIIPRIGCRAVCADGCGVQTCTAVPSVRAIAPGEAILVEWDGVRYLPGSLACAGLPDADCVDGKHVDRGRFRATVCYARAFTGQPTAERHADGTISPATLTDPTCLPVFEFSSPSYDVRYEVEMN